MYESDHQCTRDVFYLYFVSYYLLCTFDNNNNNNNNSGDVHFSPNVIISIICSIVLVSLLVIISGSGSSGIP